MLGIVVASLVVTWPLVANLNGLPPEDAHLGLDVLLGYSFAGAARTTVLRFGQFPLRSPWHGGGFPLYAHPDDLTFTPTMLLVLAVGPWAALKIDFVLTTMAAGIGMFLLTRRKMGYPLAAALVAWLILDQKHVALVMGWFLFMVGLLRLDDEENVSGTSCAKQPSNRSGKRYLIPFPPLAWGDFGRLFAVWVVGLGLAAVKLVPMWPFAREHMMRGPPDPWAGCGGSRHSSGWRCVRRWA